MMSSHLVQNVLDIRMDTIAVSGRALVSVTFLPMASPCKSRQWRLDTSLLKNENFTSPMKKRIPEFFEVNLNSVLRVATVWEAFKATCRGWLISFASGVKKEHEGAKSQLNRKLKSLEEQHMLDPSNLDVRKSLLATRADLQKLIHEETVFALVRLRRYYFESRDKAGKS